MTADEPEAPICPNCSKPARCVLHVNSIGTNVQIEHGEACFTPDTDAGNTNWQIHIH